MEKLIKKYNSQKEYLHSKDNLDKLKKNCNSKGMTGKHHTEKTKEKLRLSHLGKRKLNLPKEFYLKNYVEDKKSIKQISIELGVTESLIWYGLKRFGIPRRKCSDYDGYWKGSEDLRLLILGVA